ncbi:MAG: ribose-phosphate diphosphokinase [Candidatus Woesearchaeota archaeon]
MDDKIEMDVTRGKPGIISCKSGKHFADKVVGELERIVLEKHGFNESFRVDSYEFVFANSEVKTEIAESIRNRDIYIFQDVENSSEGMSVNDNYMALKTAIISAASSDAKHITAVVPVFPYARQDKSKAREGITAALVARELEDAGASRVITLDVHQDSISGYFRKGTLENLRASKRFMDYLSSRIPMDDLVIVAPDAGCAQRASYYARQLELPLSIMHKERDYTSKNTVDNMTLVGDVEDKDCFFIDDMVDTAGTTVKSIRGVKDKGAHDVYFAASLPLFNGDAIERLRNCYEEASLTRLIGTDVVYHGENFSEEEEWYDEVAMGSYFAKVIYNINQGRSISKLLL